MGTASPKMSLHQRNLRFLAAPDLWPNWPYLPLMRRCPGQEEEFGVLFDVMKVFEVAGYTSTVFISEHLLHARRTRSDARTAQRSFRHPRKIFAAGWRVD